MAAAEEQLGEPCPLAGIAQTGRLRANGRGTFAQTKRKQRRRVLLKNGLRRAKGGQQMARCFVAHTGRQGQAQPGL